MDENKKKKDENYDEGVFDEQELKEVMKDAIREVNSENAKEKFEKLQEISKKYESYEGEEKLKHILADEETRILLNLSNTDPNDPKYEKLLHCYSILSDKKDKKDGKDDKFWKRIDWTKILTVCLILGACGIFIFLLLIVENSQWFPRSRNALNLIMKLFTKGLMI